MNYRHIYMVIVNHAFQEMNMGLRPKNKRQKYSEQFKNSYYEMHHILPKSIFPLWKNKKSNIVVLTAREHFFCHQLLVKIYNTGENFNKMYYALFRLCTDKQNNHIKISSKEYERIKQKYRTIMSEQMEGNTFAKGGKGYKIIHKGGIITRVSALEIDYYLNQGWVIGTGKDPWNKGMKMSEEIVEKYKQSHAHLKKPKIKKERRKGFRLTEETKSKISKALTGRKKNNTEAYKAAARKRATEKDYKILLVNTNEVFNSYAEIKDKYPQVSEHVADVINGKRHYCGILNGEKMIWRKIQKN